jgi:hypothetical protein
VAGSACIGLLAAVAITRFPDKLVIVLPFAAALTFAVIAKPAIGLYGAVLASPLHLYRVSAGVANVSIFRLLLLLSVVSVGLRLLASSRPRPRVENPARLALSALFAGAFLVYEWFDPGRSSSMTIFLSYAGFLFAIGLLVAGIELGLVRRRTVLRVALFSAILPLAITLQQFLGSRTGVLPALPFLESLNTVGPNAGRSGTAFEGTFRLAGPFSDPNFLAIFCAMTFALATLERPYVGSLAWRRALDALRVACLLAILGALSRTGAIIVLLFLMLRLVTQANRGAAVARYVLPVAIAVLLAANLGLLPSGELGLVEERIRDPQSTSTHLETRKLAVKLGLEHPLQGIGLGGLGPILGEPPDRSSAHGLPFTIFAEGGFIGILLVGLALGYPLWAGSSSLRGPPRGALAAVLVVTLFLYDFAFVLDAPIVWWALVLAWDDRAFSAEGAGQAPAAELVAAAGDAHGSPA